MIYIYRVVKKGDLDHKMLLFNRLRNRNKNNKKAKMKKKMKCPKKM